MRASAAVNCGRIFRTDEDEKVVSVERIPEEGNGNGNGNGDDNGDATEEGGADV